LPKVVCIIHVKKLVWDAEATGLSGPGKGRLGAGGTGREKNPARKSRLEANGYILTTAGRPKN
jgi:hypothetical protein